MAFPFETRNEHAPTATEDVEKLLVKPQDIPSDTAVAPSGVPDTGVAQAQAEAEERI